jgi:hypothetical protein
MSAHAPPPGPPDTTNQAGTVAPGANIAAEERSFVTEMRLLIFSEAGLLNLFRDDRAHNPDRLPAGEVQTADVRLYPSLCVVVTVLNPASGISSRFTFVADTVVEIIVGYCARTGIPLPQRGTKTLDVRGREVALKMIFDPSGILDRGPL